MHLTRKLIVTAALAVALTGCSKKDEQAFSKVDYNKDGKIIFEELIVAFPDLTVEEFLAADADHSGGLDEKEYQRFAETRKSGKKLTLPSTAKTPATSEAAPAKTEAAPTTEPLAGAQTPIAPAPNSPTTQVPAGQDQTAAPTSSAQPATNQAMASNTETAEASASDHLGANEDVETVVSHKGEPAKSQATPAAQPAGTSSYVVQRGDSLSRIAKRFGVSPKAIMEANDMKNADRLEAGATITIPGKAGQPAQPAPAAVTSFVKDFFAKSDAGDLNSLLDHYADKVEYYKKGKAGRDVVRQDKAAFFTRWPKRTTIPGHVTVTETTKQGDVRVSVPVTFKTASGGKTAAGEAVFTLLLHPEDGTYKIAGENSVVGKRK